MAAKHITKADLEKLHQPKGGAGGKGCLTRHQGRDTGNMCSHQWQAKVKAEGDPHVYDKVATWAVSEPGNYDHFMRPFWHNAHHIVPNGTLNTSIAEAGKDAAGLRNLIKQGLLKASYNLNDKINMIILPQESWVGIALGLPRHLKGDEVGPNEKAEMFSHADYSEMAETKLKPIMDDYKKACKDAMDKAKGKHEAPDATLSKKAIEDLSDQLYEAIKSAGKLAPGQALATLANVIGSLVK
jgi:hypothetical protein